MSARPVPVSILVQEKKSDGNLGKFIFVMDVLTSRTDVEGVHMVALRDLHNSIAAIVDREYLSFETKMFRDKNLSSAIIEIVDKSAEAKSYNLNEEGLIPINPMDTTEQQKLVKIGDFRRFQDLNIKIKIYPATSEALGKVRKPSQKVIAALAQTEAPQTLSRKFGVSSLFAVLLLAFMFVGTMYYTNKLPSLMGSLPTDEQKESIQNLQQALHNASSPSGK